MRRCLLALALSVLALGAEPAAAAPPKPPAPLEMSGIADVLEAAPLNTIGTTESEGSGVQPVEDAAVSSPEQQPGNETPPAETEQQSEPDPAAAQPNDSSSDETVVAPAADPSAPQAEVVGGDEPQQAAEPEPAPANSADSSAPETQQTAEPEAAPANSADSSPANTSPDVEPQSDSGPSSASPSPASQSAADGQSVSRPTASSAPTTEVARAYQVWDADPGGEPWAVVAAPPAAVGNTAGSGVITAPEREPDLVPPHAGGLPALLPIELINKIGVDELFGEPVSKPKASPSASAGVAAVSVVKTKEARAGGEAGRPKATSQRAAKAQPGPDQTQQNVRRAAPERPDLKAAPTARRGPDFIVAAQRAAPGATTNPERPPWLITLLALLATAVSLAAITVIVLRPHLFGRKGAPTVPRPREPESSRNEQAGIRYRE